jgi:hypothetical protein
MSAIDLVDTGIPTARIAALRVVGPAALEVARTAGARAGRTDIVDVTPVIGTYKAYRPLRKNPKLFETAHLIDDGYAVVWDGFDTDMSAETIENIAGESMTSAEFAEFLDRNGLTQEPAAALLGRSRRQICYYVNPGPVPRVVVLACIGYETLAQRHNDIRKRPLEAAAAARGVVQGGGSDLGGSARSGSP